MFLSTFPLLLLFVIFGKMFESVDSVRKHSPTDGHAHTKFKRINRPTSRFISSKPRVQQLDTHIDDIVQIFKRNVLRLRRNTKLDLIFVIDASYSVELENFKDEIRFVSRFVSGIPVSIDTTRVAVITFADSAKVWVDQVTADNIHDHKCSLLGTSLPAITYASGSTYTYGGLASAKAIMDSARIDSKKVILLITDGRSNGGDPRGVAQRLRRGGIEIFTFGVHSGNVDELTNMASDPKPDHVYILKSFAEFESVARRALHADAEGGDYITEDDAYCNKYCSTGGNCCHSLGACRCGTTTGFYECVCDAGYFGFGLLPDGCIPCPGGTYKVHPNPGGPESCTPCPDPSMVSLNGSVSLYDCTCKSGFRRVENRCDVIRCTTIPAPLNGRFEGLHCDNKYKSSCKFHCNEGYDLVGSDVVSCSIDGTWAAADGSPIEGPTCQIRHCPALNLSPRASLNCTKEDFSYETQCNLECEEGFAVVGSDHRYCQSDSKWDGKDSTCEETRCSLPNVPSGGAISESCQGDAGTTLPYGHVCQMNCPPGFALSVLSETTCILPDIWSVDTKNAKCIDNEAPTVECPDDIVIIANPHLGATEVSWEVPVPMDNSDRVLLSATPSVTPPAPFYIGSPVVITYQAVDGAGLGDSCNFTVTVLETFIDPTFQCSFPDEDSLNEEPPIIDRCYDPQPFVIERGETIARNAEWEEPIFSDNSGSFYVNRSHEFGDLPFGQTRVTYIARDETGNSRTCVIVVSVQYDLCPTLEDPIHGHKKCLLNSNNLVECELLCDSLRFGMALQEYGFPLYTCEEDGQWQPPKDIPKDCSYQRYSSKIVKQYRVTYKMTSMKHCNDSQFLKSVEVKLLYYLTIRVPIWCQTAQTGIVCVLLSIDVNCVAERPPEPAPIDHSDYNYYDDYDDESLHYEGGEYERKKRSVYVHTRLQRKRSIQKRQARGDYYPSEPVPSDAYDSYEEDDHYKEPVATPSLGDTGFIDTLNLPDDLIMSAAGVDEEMIHELEVTVTIAGEVQLNDENITSSRKLHGQMSEYFGQLDVTHEFNDRLVSVPVRHINTSVIEYITYKGDSYDSSFGELKCPLGAVLRNSATCVNCPVGTYFDVLESECLSCETGYYQDTEAQLSCKACPAHSSTAGVHARSLDECKDLCKPGTYSSNGLERCIVCPQHTFADMHGSLECTPCVEYYGTAVRGATSHTQCEALCELGYASINGIEPCYACPVNTYQFKPGSRFCYKCPDGLMTDATGSVSYTDCAEIDRLLPPELIGGPSDRSSGFARNEDVLGLLANNKLPFSDCFKEPCRNNGTCQSSTAGYICNCSPGYSGENCAIDIDECADEPCQNGGTCSNLINQFSCSCVDGYEGVRCEIETNECDSIPCFNDANCVDLLADFTCQCLQGYTGDLCKLDIDECLSDPCLNDALCFDLVASYSCVCEPGYNGTHCEFDIDDCQSDPCLNEGICIDGVNEFRCECLLGFVGDMCEENVDDCIGATCHNDGTCMDLVNAYKCVCAPTFTGGQCETELQPYFDLSFQKPNTYHHATMTDGIRNMTEVTVAFYMQSNNTDTEGTPFSYGIGKGIYADMLTLTNLEALTLYINGEAVVTDARKLNNGDWYHIVITWISEGGAWKIYINRVLEVEGDGLQAGAVIPGGGILVIGQEQDCLGGCFSSSQEFIGTISQFNLYNYAMTALEVTSLFLNCIANKGTVKAWPDALGGIIGQVDVIEPPSFCKKCKEIEESNNLKVFKESDYKRHIGCDAGYKLQIRMESRNRTIPKGALLKCGNKGLWRYRGRDRENPSSLLFCSRLSCHHYSRITHGSINASGHLFGDSVRYQCDEGYALLGPRVITCLANQTWSAPAPKCHDVNECQDNPCHQMATCRNSEGSFYCACNIGWTGNGFVCSEINCGSPEVLNNGEIFGTNFTLNGVIQYTCNVGYELTGSSERICQENSQWSDLTPSCDPVPCEPLDIIEHGSIQNTGTVFQSIATYLCDEGFYLVGLENLTCLATRKWGNPETDTPFSPPICLPKPCGQPDYISNAYFTLNNADDFVYESYVEYSCEEGYFPIGEHRIDCQSNQQWNTSEKFFRCDPVPCPDLQDFVNGIIIAEKEPFEGGNFTFADSIKFVCLRGFNLVGMNRSVCQANGTWSNPVPLCDPVHCGMPPEVDHADVMLEHGPHKQGPHFMSELIYECDDGYRLTAFSNKTRLCHHNAKWTGNAPVCIIKDCGIPPSPDPHGYVEGDKTTFGSHLVYYCNEGYYTEASSVVVDCEADGTWSASSVPPCLPRDCGTPEVIVDGAYVGDDFTFTKSINYYCDQGYDLIGPTTLTCEASGLWNQYAPFCVPVDCGTLPEITHAILNITTTYYQSVASYTCLSGYELEGESILECLWDGLWNFSPPLCFPVDCGFVGDLKNGVVLGETQVFKSVVHFICDTGHNQHGVSNATCLASAEWSNPLPDCIPVDCGAPPIVKNAGFDWDEINSIYQTIVKYTCDSGYEMLADNSIQCQADGTWNDEPSCWRITCEHPETPEHGTMSDAESHYFEYEDVISYKCDKGYFAKGETKSTCTADKTWSNPPPICEPVDCGRLPDIAHGVKIGNSTLFMSLIVYHCNDGYEAMGDTTLECTYNGTWDREAPTCAPVSCGSPPRLRFGNVTSGNTPMSQLFMDAVAYDCAEGYYLSGKTTARCNADRTWKFEGFNGPGGSTASGRPTCRKNMCADPLSVDHATYTSRNYSYGESVTYRCDVGYENDGNNGNLECTANKGDVTGFYTGFPPVCLAVSCGLPTTIDNGIFFTTGTTFEKTAKYNCSDGYIPEGPLDVICQSNRMWSGYPFCEPRDCGPPPNVTNGNLNISSTIFPVTLNYRCYLGYQLHGPGTVTCLATGAWSDVTETSCNPVPCTSPPKVANAASIATGNVFGDTVRYRCTDGFSIFPSNIEQQVVLTCQATGEWDNVEFSCNPNTCGSAPLIKYGVVEMDSVTWSFSNTQSVYFPDTIVYSCESGYEMLGINRLDCLANVTFSSPPPSCQPLVCGIPSEIPNAAVTYSGVTFGHNTTYMCDRGHVIRHGSSETTTHYSVCGSDAIWEPSAPTRGCERIICPTPPVIMHGKILMNTEELFKYTDTTSYSCNPGYEADSHALTIMCKADRTWQDSPICDPVSCGEPFCPHLATCASTGLTFQQETVATCDPGYEFITNITTYTVACKDDGHWGSPTFNRSKVDVSECRPHSCGVPEYIENGEFVLNERRVTFGGSVTYSCNAGYEMKPTSVETLNCQVDKNWGPNSPPDCFPKDCGSVICPINAKCDSDGTIFGSTFHVACASGYEIEYNIFEARLSCQDTGEWSELPERQLDCLPVRCSQPAVIPHGRLKQNITSDVLPEFQSKITYQCGRGYLMQGEATLTCMADRSYSPTYPVCYPVPCGNPEEIRNGMVHFLGTVYLQNATYDCMPGYSLVGSSSWLCSSNGLWQRQDFLVEDADEVMSSVLPFCDPIPCGPAPNLQNGISVNSTSFFVFGEAVSYICDDGFNLHGSNSLLCLENGNFGPGPMPTCDRVPCDKPPSSEHAHLSTVSASGGPARNVFEDRVTYVCEQGYEFRSVEPLNILTCDMEGRWTPSNPDPCYPVSCGEPPKSDHASRAGDDFTYLNDVFYFCDIGYESTGSSTMSCLFNKQWSPATPSVCSPVACPHPRNIEHGSHAGENTYLKTVIYSCDLGYELRINQEADESATIKCMWDHQWDHNPPQCVPVSCGDPPAIRHGAHTENEFTFGEEVVYSCNIGHEMEGDPTVICLADRSWSLPLPICSPVSCDQTPHVANSIYQLSNSVTFGNTVKYACRPGYDLIGADTLACTKSKSYNFAPPVCAPVSCGKPEHLRNGHIVSASGAYTYQHNVTYECVEGYEISSGDLSRTAVCTAERIWSEPPPDCEPVTCGDPEHVDHGEVSFDSDTFLSLATYSCDPGYELDRDGVKEDCPIDHSCLVCQADRAWGIGIASDEENSISHKPQCLPLSCGEPPKIEHGISAVASFTFESIAEYSCETGRELYPPTTSELHCQVNYLWGPELPPICRRVNCPVPPNISHGLFTLTHAEESNVVEDESQRYLYGDVVTYHCEEGYKFANQTTSSEIGVLKCLENKMWDQIPPLCEPVPCLSPPSRNHGALRPHYSNEGHVYMDTVSYQCDVGYEWLGSFEEESVLCTADGLWSPSQPPECTPVSCGRDPIIENGVMFNAEGGTSDRRVYGSRLRFVCLNGYEMVGEETIFCGAERFWMPQIPLCKPVSCSIPPLISHGTPTLKTFSTSVTIDISPRSQLGVLPDMKPPISAAFDKSSPPADGPEEPSPPENGSAEPSPPEDGSEEPSPPEEGSEEPSPPEESSEEPSTPEEGSAHSGDSMVRRTRSVSVSRNATSSIVSEYVFEDVLVYECESGYKLNQSLPHFISCKANREWTQSIPVCEPIPCDPLPQISNAKRIGDKFEYGKKVVYSCDEGYETPEDVVTEFICDATGQFQLKTEQILPLILPSCSRVVCGEPPMLVHNVILDNTTSEFLYQDEVRYACMPGYNLLGESVLRCQADKLFDNPPPSCEPISCGEPAILPHTSINVTGIAYQDIVTYTCQEGYVNQIATVTCNADRHWSTTSLVCERVDCGFPPRLEFGIIDLNGTKFGDVALYSCRPGYISSGELERSCLASANWSSSCALCTPVDCGVPTNPINGYHTAQKNYTFGNIVLYNCDAGYMLVGEMFSMCNESGEWQRATPGCERVSCGNIPVVASAAQITGEILFGDKIVYECEFGHNLTGADTIECTSSGYLSSMPPTCPLVECRHPPHVPNAHLVSDGNYLYGNWAEYECDPGYEFPIAVTVSCTGFGIFQDVDDLACFPVQCPQLFNISHGMPSTFEGFFGDKASYICEDGYRIDGKEEISCTENAVWSHSAPLCVPVECGYPPVYEHALVADQKIYTYEMIVDYHCEKGYEFPQINGVKKKCQSDGSFTPGQIVCQPVSCAEIPPLLNGDFSMHNITFGSIIGMTCHDGYHTNNGEERLEFTCQANRAWSRNLDELICNPVPCDILPIVQHGSFEAIVQNVAAKINGGSNHSDKNGALSYGDSVTYSCDSGYYLNGATNLVCLPDGSWTFPPPVCLPVHCGEGPTIEHARFQDKNYTFGMTVSYECVVGFIMTSQNSSRQCQADGSFSEEEIFCIRIPCLSVPTVINGQASATIAMYEDIITYECDLGYELRGNNSIECGNKGHWTSSPPLCLPVRCVDLPLIPYAIIITNGMLFRNKGTIRCETGFLLTDESDEISFSCEADRAWSFNIDSVRCEAAPCERLPGIENGDMTIMPPIREAGYMEYMSATRSFTYQTSLIFTCNSGYSLVGSKTLTCGANSMWSAFMPSCLPVECEEPPSIANAFVTTSDHTFGDKAIYDCEDGYLLSSTGNFRNCNAKGNFSTHHIACSPRPCPIPPPVKYGRIVPATERPAFGDAASLVCDEGYELIGSGDHQCLATGEWSKEEAACEPVVCGTAPAIDNASPNADLLYVYSYGDTVTYSCMQGYVLNGSDHIACGADGLFEDAQISCLPILCGKVSTPMHATVEGSGVSFGDEVRVTCDPGFELKASGRVELSIECQLSGEWSQDPNNILCEGIMCESLELLTGGTLNLSFSQEVKLDDNEDSISLVYPSTVLYQCEHGYVLVGRSKRSCLTDGNWEGTKPFCQPVDCGSLPRLVHGKISGSKTTISGSVAHYECDVGYALNPPDLKTRLCQETGSWSGDSPYCSLIPCGEHPEIEHAILSDKDIIYYGSSLSINCEKGYSLIGDTTRICSSNGSFKGDPPVCERIYCGPHPTIENGQAKPETSAYFQDSVNITCDEGFKLKEGDLYRVCQEDLTWSGNPPTCVIALENLARSRAFYDDYQPLSLPCERPGVRGNKIKLVDDEALGDYYEPGSTLEFCCSRGYLPRGVMTTECVDGNWTNTPACIPKCKHRCLHNGVCQRRGHCACQRGWSGSRCHRPVCLLPCLNQGYCLAPFTCGCQSGWSGSRCQTAECDPPCHNGGKCVGPNHCNCPYGYYGDDCSQSSFFGFW